MSDKIKVTDEKEVVELLNAGWTIDQSILDGVMLIGDSHREESRCIDLDLFLDMRSECRIKKIRQMSQAHPLFHGRVDIYGLSELHQPIDGEI